MKSSLHRHRTTVALVAALFILIPVTRFAIFLTLPAGSGKKQAVVELGRGHTLRPLAKELEQRGILTSSRLFTLYARMRGSDSRVKAGPYLFDDGMRPGEILGKMLSGDIYQRLFALPEGYSTYQVAEMLEKRGFFRKDAFLAACRDKKLLEQFNIEASSVEGYLLPGSYNILPQMTETDAVKEMVSRFQQHYRARFAQRAKQAGLSTNDHLTLASMIEKEARMPQERPLIAAVFANRLKKRMRLQSDPTALYGVRAFAGRVTKADITRPSPYNTYLIPGLPPGPIGNPSPEAQEAVLNHPNVPYLFFVARGDGSHCFSSTLQEHNAAVTRYLRSSSCTTAPATNAAAATPPAR